MECLNCPNFWSNAPDAPKCENCADGKNLCDVLEEMPPLFVDRVAVARVYHLK
jgi:hypothetical protein